MTKKQTKLDLSVTLKIAYVIVLATGVLYIRSVLDTKSFIAQDKPTPKKTEKVYDVTENVILDANGKTTAYKADMRSNDTVRDLLKDLRKTQSLMYEVDEYTYGTELVSIMDVPSTDSLKWAVLLNGEDITSKITQLRVADKATYEIKQVAVTRSAEQQ